MFELLKLWNILTLQRFRKAEFVLWSRPYWKLGYIWVGSKNWVSFSQTPNKPATLIAWKDAHLVAFFSIFSPFLLYLFFKAIWDLKYVLARIGWRVFVSYLWYKLVK